ncbi:MAG: PH domain-containing protein [Acidobacteriota bacterium]|nr:PH domain-containing protein [Acidobacteriota bacterium]
MSESDSVADGLDHQLDPRVIPMQRISGGLFMAAVLLASLVGMGITLAAGDDLPGWLRMMLPLVWLVLAVLGGVFAYRWPVRAYRHTSYRVDDQGIEIRQGVYWRVVVNVPRSRVQHIDVAQGPIDRRYGLGKLVIYTAGTDHAKVELEGLEHERALRIRAHLLPSGAGDAV